MLRGGGPASWSAPTPDTDAGDSLELFRRYRSERGRSLRNAIVEQNIGFAYYLANRYAERGFDLSDLRQVALIGLVKAVERFDPERGVSFATFAQPHIVGEMRHLFRDHAWEMHVPRRIKDVSQRVQTAIDDVRAASGSEPTKADIAEATGLTVDEVLEAMEATRITRTERFEAAKSTPAAERMQPCALDDGFLGVERRELLQGMLDELDERERLIIHARFVEERTQAQIAEMVGVSQVHVSRLLGKALARLRQRLAHPRSGRGAPSGSWA